jgi:GxxExxY protein
MHENEISERIIGAAIEVHRILGPGLLESVYEEALCHELHLRGLKFVRQQSVPIPFKGIRLGTDLRLDLLIEDKVIVDLKAKENLSPIDKPKLLTYLRLSSHSAHRFVPFLHFSHGDVREFVVAVARIERPSNSTSRVT